MAMALREEGPQAWRSLDSCPHRCPAQACARHGRQGAHGSGDLLCPPKRHETPLPAPEGMWLNSKGQGTRTTSPFPGCGEQTPEPVGGWMGGAVAREGTGLGARPGSNTYQGPVDMVAVIPC